MIKKAWDYRKIHKYSSPQRFNMFPNEYRIKNYVTKRWITIYKTKDGWRLKQKDFPNMTILRQWLNTENRMFKLKRRENEKQ